MFRFTVTKSDYVIAVRSFREKIKIRYGMKDLVFE